MVNKELFLDALAETKIVSVIRLHEEYDMIPVMSALIDGGVKIMEITATTPRFSRHIAALKRYFSNNAFIGAGTILTKEELDESLACGADFIVSPVTNKDFINICVSKGIPIMPGAMTPTEIYQAWSLGASVVKTFPGRICTPGFYKDMKGPFPYIKMMPTGNVNADNAPEYIRAGACAVGIGKALCSEDDIRNGLFESITKKASMFVSLIKD